MLEKNLEEYRHRKPREALYLFAYAKGSLAPNPLPLTYKASWQILKIHAGEKRDDGSDYSSHPLDTCRIGISLGINDDEILSSLLLHDSIENGKKTKINIENEYNTTVAQLVCNQTKIEGEIPEKYWDRVASDERSVVGKGCDRLSNFKTAISTYNLPRLKRNLFETKKYLLPIIEEARHTSIKFSDALVALRDSLERMLTVMDAFVKEAEENEKLKKLLEKNKITIPNLKED